MTGTPERGRMTDPHAGTRTAIALIDRYTAGRCDYSILAGPRCVKARQEIMGVLLGRKCAQSEAGITALRERLWRLAGATEGCIARRDSELQNWLLANVAIARSHEDTEEIRR